MFVETRDTRTADWSFLFVKNDGMTHTIWAILYVDPIHRTHGCSHNCVNTIGSFVCVCFKGFEKDLSDPSGDGCSGRIKSVIKCYIINI